MKTGFVRLIYVAAILLLLAAVSSCTPSSPVPGGEGASSAPPSGISGDDLGRVPGENDPSKGNDKVSLPQITDDNCVITVFNVGKADSILIQTSSVNILIDAGESFSASLILEKLADRGVNHLDLVIVTHFDKDHVGGVRGVLEGKGITFDKVVYPSYNSAKNGYFAFRRLIEDYNLDGALKEQTTLTYGDLTLDLYPAPDPDSLKLFEEDYDNNMSLLAVMEFGGRKFVLAGDIEKERIDGILSDKELKKKLKCDWLKMPHHGKYQKNLKDFVKACDPKYAVITDSVNEPADPKTTEYLQKKGIAYYESIYGDVITVADENGITVKYR